MIEARPQPSERDPSVVVRQIDLAAGFSRHRAALEAAAARVMRSGVYVLGPEVSAFEAEFSAYLGGGFAVGCASGTDAIELALRALGLTDGARVATAAHTALATVSAIRRAGAEPCLIDVEAHDYTLDVEELRTAIRQGRASGRPIAGVVAVHLYGHAVDMGALLEVCAEFDVRLIEDCSQAHGAAFAGASLGTLGDAGCFSFYPTKNLGCFGDGGAVVVKKRSLQSRLKRLRQYGWDDQRVAREEGQNSRLDAMQAAVLRVRLPHLDSDNARRRQVADRYDAAFASTPLLLPLRRPGTAPVFHQYVVRSPDRDGLRRRLATKGVETAVHYPLPVHRHPAYAGRIDLGPARARRTEVLCNDVLSLPMHPELSDDQIDVVISAVSDCLCRGR